MTAHLTLVRQPNKSGISYDSNIVVSNLGQLLRVLEQRRSTGELRLVGGSRGSELAILFHLGVPERLFVSWRNPRNVESNDLYEDLKEVASWGTCRATFDTASPARSRTSKLDLEGPLSSRWQACLLASGAEITERPVVDDESLRSANLPQVCSDLRLARSTSSWARALLGFTLRSFERCALFYETLHEQRGEEFRGYAFACLDSEGVGHFDRTFREAILKSGQGSILRRAARTNEVERGPLERTASTRQLVRTLGGEWPAHFVVIPLRGGLETTLLLCAVGSEVPTAEQCRQLEVVSAAANAALLRAASRKLAPTESNEERSLPETTMVEGSSLAIH